MRKQTQQDAEAPGERRKRPKKNEEKNEIAPRKASQVPARMIDYQASKGRGGRKHRGL